MRTLPRAPASWQPHDVDATRASLLDIVAFLEAERARGATTIEVDVADPDRGRGLYAGERVRAYERTALSDTGSPLAGTAHTTSSPPQALHDAGTPLAGTAHAISTNERLGAGPARIDAEPPAPAPAAQIHRPLRVWLDLAERLRLRLCTPRPRPDGTLRLRFELLDAAAQIRGGTPGTEKYGTASDFARIRKHEDPGFVLDLRDALERVLATHAGVDSATWRVLYLGCNTGDEIQLVRELSPALRDVQHVGVDHSTTAIAAARARFADESAHITFHEADLAVAQPASGRFDLVISIGTLQSGALDDRDLLRRLVQDHLTPRGAVILGIPNCRYVDGEVEYGARMKNFRQPELGLVMKDIAFYRKYLQQHRKQVFVTGKHYVLVTAVPTADDAVD